VSNVCVAADARTVVPDMRRKAFRCETLVFSERLAACAVLLFVAVKDRETERGSEVVIYFSWFEDDSRVGEELFWRPSGVSE
jgi:hypothetical protein